ncbi:MAG: hypothetical protein FWE55_04385 [Synergistaceae bacterium]|nr:hypothetical protein [Synergistaceae bacterium]
MSKLNPDCLIFDVDGVLISSRDTFVELIRLLIEREWEKSGNIADATGYSNEMNRILKAHGSFNEDYDIAWFLLNIASSRKTKKLSEGLPSPEMLREIISECSGPCGQWMPGRFELKFDLGYIRSLGINMYTGDDGGGGMWRLDKPAIESHWSELPLPVYIYTGREMKEWRFARNILGWEDFPDERIIHLDTGIHKPSPKGLEVICSKFRHERPIFFGDTMSDKLSYDAFGRGWFAVIGDTLKDELLNDRCLHFPDVKTALSLIFS